MSRTESDPGQEKVVAFLSDPRAHSGGGPVQRIDTHASRIFLAGERVYKLKRALRYSYLDYSTVDLRRRACLAELALNRRTAPTLYLDVLPVVRRPDGGMALGGEGVALDWVVVMRRFPQEALFSHLAEQGALTPRLAMQTADRIAAFHEIAEQIHNQGGAAGIRAVIEINDANLRRCPPAGVGPADIDRLREATAAALERHAVLLDRRRDSGKVRRCHGDLHLGNIALIDGAPVLFDCIEFSDLIACIDVLYDLAFLLMDLRRRGLVDPAAMIFNRYLDRADEADGLAVLPLFLSLRAAVRAHVTATAAQSTLSARRDAMLAEARRYFDAAAQALCPVAPHLVAIGGLSGTGKSAIAAAIAADLGTNPAARVLRSDVLRKRMFGVAPEARLPAETYTPAVNAQVYAALRDAARQALAAGCSVIIDAVAARVAEREDFAALAAACGVPFSGLWLEAAPEILEARIAARQDDASDADRAVLRQQLTYDLGPMRWTRLDAGRIPDEVVQAARAAIGLPPRPGSPHQAPTS
jgi:aminoglycoside phosphotransferase family enzyme/predicted kinase